MDARIAIITGTVFAGVLVAGALAAPRGGSTPSAENDAAIITTATAQAPSRATVVRDAPIVSQTASGARDDDDDDGDRDDHKTNRDHEEDDD